MARRFSERRQQDRTGADSVGYHRSRPLPHCQLPLPQAGPVVVRAPKAGERAVPVREHPAVA